MSTCRNIVFLFVVIALANGAQSAFAVITIVNPSFEQPFIPPMIDMLSTPTGWLAFSPGGGHPATVNGSGAPSRLPSGAVDGNQAAHFGIESTTTGAGVDPLGQWTNALYQVGVGDFNAN